MPVRGWVRSLLRVSGGSLYPMKMKQLGNFYRARIRPRLGRLKPLLPRLIMIRVALTILMIPSGAVGQAVAPKQPTITPATGAALEGVLASLYRSQKTNGAYDFADPTRGFERFPLYATVAMDAYRATGNLGALSQSMNSVSSHYSWLFASEDRDGDRLIETLPAGRNARVEEPGLNALLALDLRSLARIHLELRRTLHALHWYNGARGIEQNLVTGSFDDESGYLFARDASGRPIREVDPIASLAANYPGVMGGNHAAPLAEQVVAWAGESASAAPDNDPDAAAVDALVACDVLRAWDHAAVAQSVQSRLAGIPAYSALPIYARERVALTTPLVDDLLAMDLFYAVVRASAKFPDTDVVRLEKAISIVRACVSGRAGTVTRVNGDGATRTVYATVSQMREKLRSTAFFSLDEKRAYPGTDITIASQRLLDDVVACTRRAESNLMVATSNVRVRASLASATLVSGESAVFRCEIASDTPRVWKTVSAGVYGEAVARVNTGFVHVNASNPYRFALRRATRAAVGGPRVLTFTVVLEDTSGTRVRCHVDQSVFVQAPVGITARFPAGRTVRGKELPIELDLRRNSRGSVPTRYYWYSPAGLKLREGNSGEIAFGAADTTGARLNVEIPSPCRPGVFPFTLKFMSGDRDAGSITASLFKPYQWTYAGPFPAKGKLDKAFPPEQGVNLLQSYDGVRGKVSWRAVPEAATGPHGELRLEGLASEPGAHYLYTVVACAYETDIATRFSSNVPVAIFVNGRQVASSTGAPGDSVTANVHLDPDRNHILVKIIGDASARVTFSLGNDENLAADEFDNNLMELAGGYRELTARELSEPNPLQASQRSVTLRYMNAEAQSVAVVGSFNGWSPEANPMLKKEGAWEIILSLAPGKYSYRFLVDQRKQTLDPSASKEEPDGFGGKNSVLVVEK